ncbi:hypothetical protein [Acinetobacter oleivorans]|uniref:hypothetical protein n=1 Tax=Acinetobacter oleivorans TaxID=1148157 RepID=UPI003AF432C6
MNNKILSEVVILNILEDPELKKKMESEIGGTIMQTFTRAGYQPPIPILQDGILVYADPALNKYADRLRKGAMILIKVLSEIKSEK